MESSEKTSGLLPLFYFDMIFLLRLSLRPTKVSAYMPGTGDWSTLWSEVNPLRLLTATLKDFALVYPWGSYFFLVSVESIDWGFLGSVIFTFTNLCLWMFWAFDLRYALLTRLSPPKSTSSASKTILTISSIISAQTFLTEKGSSI